MKKNKFIVVCIFSTLGTFNVFAAAEDSITAEEFYFPVEEATIYLEKYYKIAIQEMENAKIPASITLAQGMLESDFGRSDLATQANNHFGIKCGGNWNGSTFYKWDDDAEKSCFRKYDQTIQSYKDHSAFLKKERYAELFKLPIEDYKGWAKGLKNAGYATSTSYPQKLIALIERYRLFDYDSAIPNSQPPLVDLPATTPGTQNNGILFSKAGKKYTLVLEGETLEKLAIRTGKLAKNILVFNELKNKNIAVGQLIWLQEKDAKYAGNQSFHKAKAAQTLYDVAQIYNLKVERLVKINSLKANAILKEGQKVRLKTKEPFLKRFFKKLFG